MYNTRKLSPKDLDLLNKAMRSIAKLRQIIEERIFNLEQQIHQFVSQKIQESDFHNVIYEAEICQGTRHLGELLEKFYTFTKVQNNSYQLKTSNCNNILEGLAVVPQKVHDMTKHISHSIKSIKIGEVSRNQKVATFEENQDYEVWQYKGLAKTNDAFVANVFQSGQCFAQPFYPIASCYLKGIYHSFLFKGKSNVNAEYDCQEKPETITIRIHEGFDLSDSIYEESFTINHKEFVKSGLVQNGAYKLEFASKALLRKGMPYTISSRSTSKFYTHIHSGKEVKFEQKNILKFMAKEPENLHQMVDMRLSQTQSCVPGFMLTTANN